MKYTSSSNKCAVMEFALHEPVIVEYANRQAPIGDRQNFYIVREQERRSGVLRFDQLTFHPVDTLLLIGTKDALRGLKKKDADWLRQNL